MAVGYDILFFLYRIEDMEELDTIEIQKKLIYKFK